MKNCILLVSYIIYTSKTYRTKWFNAKFVYQRNLSYIFTYFVKKDCIYRLRAESAVSV